MWSWILAYAASASQLAVDRHRDALVVVTTWHGRAQVWRVPLVGEPVMQDLPGSATNPTVACARRCEVGWIRPATGLVAGTLERRGLGPIATVAPDATRALFAADGQVYVQARVRTERGLSWSVSVASLGDDPLLDRRPIAEDTLPGLYAIDGAVWWRRRDGALTGTGAGAPDGFPLLEVVDGEIVPLGRRAGQGDPLLASVSPDGDAAAWVTPDGTLRAAWLDGGRVVAERVVEQVEPERAAHAFVQQFVGATLADEEDGLAPLAIPVDVRREWLGELTITLGERSAAFTLVPAAGAPGEATLAATSRRDAEGAPEQDRRDRLVAWLPALAGPCGIEEGLRLTADRDGEQWHVGLVGRGGALDFRLAGAVAGPPAGEGEGLSGEVRCGAVAVPLRASWRVGPARVTEALTDPKPLWAVF